MNKMQSLPSNNINSNVVKKSVCKYVTRQTWKMPLEKLKQSSLWFCWDFKDFHTRFIPFYNRIKIIYLLQLQGVRLTFLNVNDVRTPLLFKVKSPTSRVIIPLLWPLDAWTVSNFLGVILKSTIKIIYLALHS